MKTAQQRVEEIEQEEGGKITSREQSVDWTKRLTDTFNAEKINDFYGDRLRFDHRRNRWLIWEGHRWQPDTDGKISRFAIEASRKLYLAAVDLDSDKKARVSQWAIRSENKVKLDASVGLAKNLLPIADKGDDWDVDTMLLSCANGILDLKTNKLRDGKPEDRITMAANVAYDPKADCPRWKQFINEIFEGKEELIHYIHKALGYSLTGDVSEQVLFFCFGVGANGKSVLFTTIRELLKDYAYSAPASMFQRSTANKATNDVAALEFKRFLMSSEVLAGSKIDELRLKKWSGGDQETVRFLYKEFFSFYPVCKIWLFVNHRPKVEDDSYGFWRRVRLIPFNRVFKPEEQDKDLTKELKEELPGILNWLVEGCLLWQKEGLEPTPEIVLSETKAFQEENDVLAEFITDYCVEIPNAETTAAVLFKAYNEWASAMSLVSRDTLSRTMFGRRMGAKFSKTKKSRGWIYQGIGLQHSMFGENSEPGFHVQPQNRKLLTNSSHEEGLSKTGSNMENMERSKKDETNVISQDKQPDFKNTDEEVFK